MIRTVHIDEYLALGNWHNPADMPFGKAADPQDGSGVPFFTTWICFDVVRSALLFGLFNHTSHHTYGQIYDALSIVDLLAQLSVALELLHVIVNQSAKVIWFQLHAHLLFRLFGLRNVGSGGSSTGSLSCCRRSRNHVNWAAFHPAVRMVLEEQTCRPARRGAYWLGRLQHRERSCATWKEHLSLPSERARFRRLVIRGRGWISTNAVLLDIWATTPARTLVEGFSP